MVVKLPALQELTVWQKTDKQTNIYRINYDTIKKKKRPIKEVFANSQKNSDVGVNNYLGGD